MNGDERLHVLLYIAVVIVVVFSYGMGIWVGGRNPEKPQRAIAAESPTLLLTDRLVMTVAIGMGGTAVIVDVGFAESDPRQIREMELRGDMCDANGVKNLPTEPGAWRCIVDEWSNEIFREFRVTEARRLL